MRLSRASLYALHALCFLARNRTRDPVSTRAIAAATGISVVFLLKALKPCVDRQLLSSATGPHGGYRLARSAARISVLQVVEARALVKVRVPWGAIVPWIFLGLALFAWPLFLMDLAVWWVKLLVAVPLLALYTGIYFRDRLILRFR